MPQVEVQKSMARIRDFAISSQDAPSQIVNKELARVLAPEFRAYWQTKGNNCEKDYITSTT